MILGCGVQSNEPGAKSKEQEIKSLELKVESKGLKVETEGKEKIQRQKNEVKPKKEVKKANKKSEQPELSDKETKKKVRKLIKKINQICMVTPNIDLAVGIAGYYGQDIEEIGITAIPVVVREFANRRNWKTRFYLGRLLERLVKIRDKEGYFIRHNTHTEYSDNVAQVLGKILEDKRENIWVRWGAAKGLIAGGDKAIEPLIRVLRTIQCEPFIPLGDEEFNQKDKMKENFCFSVLYSLGHLLENSKDRKLIDKAIDAIKDKLYDKNYMIRMSAVSALGGGGIFSKRARDILIDTLKNHECGHVKSRVPGALAFVYNRITDENEKDRIVDALIEAASASLEVEGFDGIIPAHRNIFAIKRLGEIKAKKAVEPLIKALKDKEDLVVGESAIALGKIGDKRAIKPLEEALRNAQDKGLKRDIAINGLKPLTGKDYQY
jgi:hypothetical protein